MLIYLVCDFCSAHINVSLHVPCVCMPVWFIVWVWLWLIKYSPVPLLHNAVMFLHTELLAYKQAVCHSWPLSAFSPFQLKSCINYFQLPLMADVVPTNRTLKTTAVHLKAWDKYGPQLLSHENSLRSFHKYKHAIENWNIRNRTAARVFRSYSLPQVKHMTKQTNKLWSI